MARQNGDVTEGALWSETETPVPLGSYSETIALAEPAINGDRAAASIPPRRHRESEPSAADFAAERSFGLPRGDRSPAGGSHCFA